MQAHEFYSPPNPKLSLRGATVQNSFHPKDHAFANLGFKTENILCENITQPNPMQHARGWERTSSKRSITRLICAPTGDFWMIAICCSFSVSLVNENRCDNGTMGVDRGGGAGALRDADDDAALGRVGKVASVACSFSCCLLKFASFCANAIFPPPSLACLYTLVRVENSVGSAPVVSGAEIPGRLSNK